MNEQVSGRSQPGEDIDDGLGFGFLESVYQKCLLIELRRGGMEAASRQPIVVRYDDEVVGEFVAEVPFILSSCQKERCSFSFIVFLRT